MGHFYQPENTLWYLQSLKNSSLHPTPFFSPHPHLSIPFYSQISQKSCLYLLSSFFTSHHSSAFCPHIPMKLPLARSPPTAMERNPGGTFLSLVYSASQHTFWVPMTWGRPASLATPSQSTFVCFSASPPLSAWETSGQAWGLKICLPIFFPLVEPNFPFLECGSFS